MPNATRSLEGLAETLRARSLSVRVLEGPRVPAPAKRARAIEAGLVVLRAGTARRVEALIDEIGSQSFPASDPPAWVR